MSDLSRIYKLARETSMAIKQSAAWDIVGRQAGEMLRQCRNEEEEVVAIKLLIESVTTNFAIRIALASRPAEEE